MHTLAALNEEQILSAQYLSALPTPPPKVDP